MFRTSFFVDQCQLVVHELDGQIVSEDLIENDLLFVWGELMNPHFVRGITGRFVPCAPAVLPGFHRRVEGRPGGGWEFSIAPRVDSFVLGMVLIGLTAEDRETLDRFERCPAQMARRTVDIRIGDLDRTAQMYFPANVRDG